MNICFFGSSRTYRQVDPFVFDSIINQDSSSNFRSFNLGAPGCFSPQIYFLYENFLKSKLVYNTKYCFIELMEIDQIRKFDMHKKKNNYWHNLPDFVFVVRSILVDHNLMYYTKLDIIRKYFISIIENIFHLGHFDFLLLNETYYDIAFIGDKMNGYYSLEKELKNTRDSNFKKHLSKRKKLFSPHSNNSLLDTTFLKHYRTLNNLYNYEHLNRIESLINLSVAKNIHLIFFMSPGNSSQELVNLSHHIPKSNFIDMSDANKFLELYQSNNYFDSGHLNETGSYLYSQRIAESFIELLDK